jgi:hypothetical protein
MLALAIAACGGLKVRAEHDRSADFTGLRTYAWMPDSQETPGDPRVDNRDVDERIRAAVDRQLAARGYEHGPAESADFWVTYHAALAGDLETQTVNRSYDAAPGWSYGTGRGGRYGWSPGASGAYVPQYRKGSLIIDFVAPQTKTLIWRGSAEAKLEISTTPEEQERRLQDAVRRIIEQFPPS